MSSRDKIKDIMLNARKINAHRPTIVSSKKGKPRCPCAVKLSTKKRTRELLEKGEEGIFFRLELHNGKEKSIPYKKCTRPVHDDNDFCWKHNERAESAVHYQRDLVDNEGDGVRKATLEDSYFEESTGRGGGKNKLTSLGLTTKHKRSVTIDQKLREDILRTQKELAEFAKGLASLMDSDAEENGSDAEEEPISAVIEKAASKVDADSDVEAVDSEDDISSPKAAFTSSAVKSDSDADADADSDDEKEEIVPILADAESNTGSDDEEATFAVFHTKDGRELLLDGENNVYNEEDDNTVELGVLMEVESDLAPIYRDTKHFIVGEEITFRKRPFIRCVISGFAFQKKDDKLVFKGQAKELADGNFSIVQYKPKK